MRAEEENVGLGAMHEVTLAQLQAYHTNIATATINFLA
jgi:hypothetical protein